MNRRTLLMGLLASASVPALARARPYATGGVIRPSQTYVVGELGRWEWFTVKRDGVRRLVRAAHGPHNLVECWINGESWQVVGKGSCHD